MERVLPALRWALYADLGVAFGVPMAAWSTGMAGHVARWRCAIAWAAVLGIGISLAGFAVSAAVMAGLGVAELDCGLVMALVTGTALGWALVARCLALLALGGLAMSRQGSRPLLLALPGAIAACSLAWSGHAAASQGFAAWARLGGDGLHLLAGLTWIGALVLFAVALRTAPTDPRDVRTEHAGLAAFAGIGTLLVATLVASGLANLLFVLPVGQWAGLPRTAYGVLLLVKLLLFCGMLGLAAWNRFVLVPSLARAVGGESAWQARPRLHRAITLELVLGLGVLGAVAALGVLDPQA